MMNIISAAFLKKGIDISPQVYWGAVGFGKAEE
jgi:hypothetical protein